MKSILAMSAIAISVVAATTQVQAQQKYTAADVVALFEKASGNHPGKRKAHAKGVCASATFTPNANAAFDGAALLTSGELPVTMRFSLGGGNPNADERAPGTRGMGMQIKLPNGMQHVFTGNNFPVFAGKDPDTFVGFLLSLVPDESGKPNMQKVGAYIQANPSVAAHAAWQQKAGTAASYANTQFFGLHTFYYDNAKSERTKFRWELVPELGVQTYDKEQAAALPAAFLQDKMQQQVISGKVSYKLEVSVGEEADSDIDPSSQWPADRPRVTLGTVTVKEVGGASCDPINFDPNILSAGFTPSADPVLQMRSPAYAISFGKRLSGQ